MRFDGWLYLLRSLRAILGVGAFCAVSLNSIASAQIFRVPNPGAGSVALTGAWQFNTGDNPEWASSSFDDSHWKLLGAETPWGAQGYPGYAGFAWYRRRIEVAGSGSALALLIPPVDDAYQVFWNGKLIGSYGAMPPRAKWFAFGHSAVYRLLDGDGAKGAADREPGGELAIRVWKAPLYSSDDAQGGGFEDVPVLGDPAVLELMRAAPEDAFAAEILPRVATALIMILLGLAAGVLGWLGRQAILGWLAAYLVVAGCYSLLWLPVSHFGWSATTNQFWTQIFSSAREPSLWYLLLAIFDLSSSRRWRWTSHAFALFYASCALADCLVILLWQNAGNALQHTDTVLSSLPALLPIYSLVLIVCGLRKHPRLYLWPLAAAAVLTKTYAFLVEFAQLFLYTGWEAFFWLIKPHLVLGRYTFSLHTLFNMLLSFVLIVTVAQVQARYRRRQAALEMEVQSAREVQRVLMPEELPAIPGFSLATAFQPAGEVGGDFFQTIPVPGGVLIVLGDVSGKGMGAAMTVSLIVGTVRTLCEADSTPSAVLEGLNRRLLGRVRGGFATCLAVLVTPGGKLRIANAGHLPPFLSGKELVLPGSLPLGLVAGVTYEEQINWLPVGDQLTLYTDGVLEARNKRGDLYGFERVEQLLASSPSPETVLAAMCNFGQDDDITVLALTRLL